MIKQSTVKQGMPVGVQLIFLVFNFKKKKNRLNFFPTQQGMPAKF